jgi:hypothetical protein
VEISYSFNRGGRSSRQQERLCNALLFLVNGYMQIPLGL